MRSPRRGGILLADPMLKEPCFDRSAVLLIDADRSGGFLGLTLNKILPYTVGDIFPDWEVASDIPMFSGGPVDKNRLFMLHCLGSVFEGSMEIMPGLYLGGKFEDIVRYIDTFGDVDGKIRFFIGYSGWAPGQLVSEINGNSWALYYPDKGEGLLSGCENDYWRRMVGRLGPDYRNWLVVPPDPRLN